MGPVWIHLYTSEFIFLYQPEVQLLNYYDALFLLFRLHGHNKLKEFILSQHPMEEVREDFWRMLWDHNAQTVVLLSSIDKEVT